MLDPNVSGRQAAAALPRATYRLRGPGIEVTYQRGDSEIALQLSDSGLDHLSGTREVTAATDELLGARVDAELLISRGGVRIILTLLLPEAADAEVGPPVEVSAVAVLTHNYARAMSTRPPVQQKYEVKPLTGTMTLEV
ncbi:MAG: hypothetical protein WKF96_11870 [Solirubrobacteraceae bacterium]